MIVFKRQQVPTFTMWVIAPVLPVLETLQMACGAKTLHSIVVEHNAWK